MLLKRFPVATVATTSLAPAGAGAVCGEVEADGEPARLFFVRDDSTRLRMLGDLDIDLGVFLKECGIARGSAAENQVRQRWDELAALWQQRLAAEAQRNSEQRRREQFKKWVDDNEERLRALNEAADRLQ